ncbi:LPXTG cell wall anchor domain-containing protein [Aurantimicrobium sp. INA4]|uniref:WD40/YVTN/BNR-like repeat-containing protein n=1 Tax=Aurantimicrobium sp. INA4 TaxID=2986279 RepID=UPI0024908A39|nr:LPXTG cell wall anchor domain-containing protein [Aurantimicrobium sp. INA4]
MSYSPLRTFIAALAVAVVAAFIPVASANAADMGTTWNNATLPNGAAGLDSIAFGNGVFVGVNTQGDVLRSTDGKTWSSVQQSNVVWSSAAFGGGVFVILGEDGSGPVFKRSTDNGVTFSNANSSGLSSSGYTGLSFGQNTFIAMDTQSGCFVAVSTDSGQTWNDGGSSDSCDEYQSSVFGNGVWVSASTSPSVEFNNDPVGSGWNSVQFANGDPTPQSGEVLSELSFNGTEFMFLIHGLNGSVYKYTSTDGENWSARTLTNGLPSSEYSGLAWDGAAWLAGAGGSGTGIYRSSDGVAWTRVDANNTQWYSFAAGSGIVVSGGQPQVSTGAQGLNSTIAVGWSADTPAPSPSPTPSPSPSELPKTGISSGNVLQSLFIGGLLVALGALLVRRVKTQRK